MARKLAILLLLLLGAPLLALTGWIALNRTDLPTPRDEDLRLERSTVPEDANGFHLLIAAVEAVDMPGDKETWERLRAFRAGETQDTGWILAHVARNRQAIELLRAALAAPVMQLPPPDYEPEAMQVRTDLLPTLQQLVHLAGAESRIALERGDPEQAIELASLGLRLGHALSAAESVALLDLLVAASCQSLSLQDLEHVVRELAISGDTARELLELLAANRLSQAGWREVWAFEYQFVKAAFEAGLATADGADPTLFDEAGAAGWTLALLPGSYLLHPNRTLSELAGGYRDQVQKSARFCTDAGLAVGEAAEEETGLGARVLLLPNPVGRILLEVARPDLDRFQLRRCYFETRLALTQTLIALKAYWHEHASLPERLDDLVPAWIAAVPRDAFDGAPIRYSRSEQRIHSIGDDLVDGGGESADPTDRAEPSLSLAF